MARPSKIRRYTVTDVQAVDDVATLYGKAWDVGQVLLIASRQAKRYLATGQLEPAAGEIEEGDVYIFRSPRYGRRVGRGPVTPHPEE